jgi:phospholipid/cholesterol/gamma-HCH transport system ATP-binding protein
MSNPDPSNDPDPTNSPVPANSPAAMGSRDSADNAISIRNLVVDYGTRRILKGVDLDIPTGKVMVIMGSSGAGKSTLLRCILGLKKPSSGNIHMLGTDIATASSREIYEIRKQMGVAFQGGALISSMSVAENIQLPLREHTNLDENTIRIMTRIKLDMVNMLPAENLMPAELSGGMTKRAALARAIIMDPKLLFFDEPSSGLDPSTAAELDELILLLKTSMRMTIVVVTHELESTFKIADHIAIIGEGRVLETGTPEQIRVSTNPEIQDLLNRKPRETIVDTDAHLRRLTGLDET